MLPAASRIASAQSYPTRPVRIIVGFGAGSSPDITARLIGQRLSERLGQPFIIDDRPGAGSNIGTEAVVRALPDGHTLLWVTTANTVSATFYDKLGFNFVRDITPVVAIARFPNVMVVNPQVPATSVPQFIAYAKANPGKINMASAGNGQTDHISGELFKMMAGVELVHVPYRGSGPAVTDLIGGQVQVHFGIMASAIGYIRDGRLRPLAVTTAQRWDGLPDLPTVAEFVPGYETSSWHGLGVPKDTPAAIIDKLNQEINAALADPDIKTRLGDLGGTVIGGSRAAFAEFITTETAKWAEVIKFAGIKVD